MTSWTHTLTSYLVQLRPTPTTRRRQKRDVAVGRIQTQVGPVFLLPYELFQEILLSLFVPSWTEVYCRYLHANRRHRPLTEEFWTRTRALLALGATCRTVRKVVLAGAWKHYAICRVKYEIMAETKLLSRCGILLENPHLAVFVRTLVVDFMGASEEATKLFVECLATLPNLHTLEIFSMQEHELVQAFATALEERKPPLQQVRTLVLPPTAHWLLRYCPNVEDLTCCAMRPNNSFVESLMAGGPNHITKFSSLYLVGTDPRPIEGVWLGIAGACPGIRDLSVVHERTSLTMSKQCISAFENLSTIRLIYCPDFPTPDLTWDELKNAAIGQLKDSSAESPKKLKTVVLIPGPWTWANSEPESMAAEETLV